MGKIKVTLASGNVLEKPLVTCFQGTNGNYLVLDNEANGSMGLPIICISKFNGTTAEKIVDQNEWVAVKENLKSIISGTQLSYLPVPETISAADDFYTQLTLPLASFDLLKNVYAPAPAQNAEPAAAPVEAPIPDPASMMGSMPDASQMGAAPAVPVEAPIPDPASMMGSMPDASQMGAAPVVPVEAPIPDPTTMINPAFNQVDMPATTDIPLAQPNAENPIIPNPVENSAGVEISPIIPVDQANINNDDINVIKDNFLKSCETMFDALIQKIQNK